MFAGLSLSRRRNQIHRDILYVMSLSFSVTSTGLCGRAKQKRVPPPGLYSRHSRPPCASIITRQIDRPTPSPLDFVVTKGSNNFTRTVDGKPGPLSAILIWINPSGVSSDATVRTQGV